MRRNDKEIRDKQIIEEILSQSDICRIAMLDGDRPYMIPVNFGYSNGAIYIHGAREGKKIELLRKNNIVCFEIENKSEIIKGETSCGWSTRYRSLIGYGKIEFIEETDQKKHGMDIIMQHYGKKGSNDYPESQLQLIVILKLTIDQVTGKQSGDWN